MPLPDQWATLEDFATLFQYFWHRDFPMGHGSIGANRSDWTLHIGVAVRSVADLMGLVTRFERGGKKDAVLRSFEGDEIAIEWEWDGVWGNELMKLKTHKVYNPNEKRPPFLKYAVLITYTDTPNIERAHTHVKEIWNGAGWPLLLVLIDWERAKGFSSKKKFKSLTMSAFDTKGMHRCLRVSPAFPWNVDSTRWWGSMPLDGPIGASKWLAQRQSDQEDVG